MNGVHNSGDRGQILELKYEYCNAIDHDDEDSLLSVFTDDAVIESVGMRGSYDGRAEYREWCADVTNGDVLTAHIALNPRIEVYGDEAVGAWYYLVFVVEDDDVELGQGEYEETYRRIEGEWRISARTARRNLTVNIGELTEASAGL